ncbi:hypothetical protein CYLTODRAFT_455773 [Cylindrobasidium torrendii FP15055 ss-10]|uniref:Uncharacterized protein n=1 Tax=Cylindrobasidium torrendii FP15055 ss-10 TaxID=1314674 RepID=A0A0D7B655_9AGAR|nr:hypothetical protein CYLTODRAFT_455773 [Cylindrobasidium torrendii FP15055 ss-10]
MGFEMAIYQSIGYEEFFAYLSAPDCDTQESPALAVSNMKTSTQQYAKNTKQTGVCFANISDDQSNAFYMLDVSDINAWDPKVREPVLDIVNCHARSILTEDANGMLAIPAKITNPSDRLEAQKKMICDLCTADNDQPVMVETLSWDAHMMLCLTWAKRSAKFSGMTTVDSPAKRIINHICWFLKLASTTTEQAHPPATIAMPTVVYGAAPLGGADIMREGQTAVLCLQEIFTERTPVSTPFGLGNV